MNGTPETEDKGPKFKHPTLADSIDAMMTVVKPKGWIALYCALAILLVILIWGFVGKIPIIVNGHGIALSTQGTYVVVAKTGGTVVEILISEGEYVKEGQALMRLVDPLSQLAIDAEKQKIAIMEANFEQLKSRVAQEGKDRGIAIEKKIQSEELALANSESTLPYLQKDLEAKTRLNDKGIVSKPDLERARMELQRTQNAIAQSKANILTLKADLATEYRAQEIKAAEINIFEEKKKVEQLLLQRTFLFIKSEREGEILEILVSNGDTVKPGQVVASLELPLAPGEYLRYFAAIGGEYGVLLKKGLPVQIEVAGVDPKQYGYLRGSIEYISPYPVSQAELVAVVSNPQLAEFLRGGTGPVYSVFVRLYADPSTPSGLKWTTTYGPPQKLSTGTIGTVRVVVQEKHPIFYILPGEIGPYVQEHLEPNPSNHGETR